jgi:hypothetical protein
VCVFGYGLILVGRLSSYREKAREARDFIPWTMKTVDCRGLCRLVMDYTLRCLVCKWTDSPMMDCPDMCLEAL